MALIHFLPDDRKIEAIEGETILWPHSGPA